MEQFDLYDLNKKVTGKVINRGDEVPSGYYRYVVHAVILNSKGKMLIQRRSDNKKNWPSMWDISVGGCVVKGETPNEGIQRELKEELGIDYDFKAIRPVFTFSFSEGFDDFYALFMDVDTSSLTLQKEEVSDVKFASLSEIKELIKEGKFIKYQDHFMDFIFEMVTSHDVFKE